jgi:signal transduction histidine kinase
MMNDFLFNNRDALIERCKAKVATRPRRAATKVQLENGIPMFLDQLIKTLEIEQGDEPMNSREVSGPSGGSAEATSEMGISAAQHGHSLLKLGYTVDQVVHDYGDLCQAITDLAFERDAPFSVDEFRTLNRCLDNAIADAVSEFTFQRDAAIAGQQAVDVNVMLGNFAHELRNILSTASLAYAAIKSGNLPLSGATGAVLESSLVKMGYLIDRSLAEVRIVGGLPGNHQQMISVSEFFLDIQHAALLDAQARGCTLLVSEVDPQLAVEADRDLLFAAVGNLLQNAFKFTHPHTEVSLAAFANEDHVLIEVRDHCGGLPSGSVETLFSPFHQRSADKTGLGLGLSIARRSIESFGGILSVRDLPGDGCIFTISLPRHTVA